MNGADRTNSNSVLGHRLDNKTSAPIKSSKKVGSVPATLPPAGTPPVGKPSPFPDGTPGYWATNVNIPLLSRLYDNLSSKWRCGLVDESVLLIAKASVQSGRFSFDKWLVDSTSVAVSSPQKTGGTNNTGSFENFITRDHLKLVTALYRKFQCSQSVTRRFFTCHIFRYFISETINIGHKFELHGTLSPIQLIGQTTIKPWILHAGS